MNCLAYVHIQHALECELPPRRFLQFWSRVYFWWQNIKGIHESSEKALRIMQLTTVMVVDADRLVRVIRFGCVVRIFRRFRFGAEHESAARTRWAGFTEDHFAQTLHFADGVRGARDIRCWR